MHMTVCNEIKWGVDWILNFFQYQIFYFPIGEAWVSKHLPEDDDFTSAVISLPVKSVFVYRMEKYWIPLHLFFHTFFVVLTDGRLFLVEWKCIFSILILFFFQEESNISWTFTMAN